MNPFLQKRVKVSDKVTPTGNNGVIAFTGTGDKFYITPGNPIAIIRWGIIFSIAKDASALVATLDVRPTLGSDSNRATKDTLTDGATARAAGVSLERRITGTNPNSSTGADGSLVNVAALPTVVMGEGVSVLPGQEAVFAVTTAASSSGSGYVYAEYVEYPSVPEYASLQSTTLNYTVVQL